MADPKKPKIDPQEHTIYSTVFEQKEMGKNMDKSTEKAVPLGEGEPKKTTKEGVTLYLGKPKSEATKKKQSALRSDPAVERHFGSVAACKALELVDDMISKAEGAAKAALGSFKIRPGGPVEESTGKPMESLLAEAAKKRERGGALPPPAPTQKAVTPGPGMGGGVVNPSSSRVGGGVKLASAAGDDKAIPINIPITKSEGETTEKAISARSVPRLSRAMLSVLRDDPMRSGSMVLTRPGNIPLRGDLMNELPEDATRRDQERLERSYGVYKSCSGCGRRYLAKSADAECPTCSVNKSLSCSTCGRALVKSHGGGPAACPICN